MDNLRDSADLAAENAKLREENQRLRERLEEKDRHLSQVFAALANERDPGKKHIDDELMVIWTNARGAGKTLYWVGKVLIWAAAAVGAGLMLIKHLKS